MELANVVLGACKPFRRQAEKDTGFRCDIVEPGLFAGVRGRPELWAIWESSGHFRPSGGTQTGRRRDRVTVLERIRGTDDQRLGVLGRLNLNSSVRRRVCLRSRWIPGLRR